MSEYSLDEVYGKGAPAPAAPKEFSLEDVYGAPKHKSDGEIALGGLKAAGKAVAGEAAAVGDMVLGMPGAAAGSIAELGLRAGLSKDKGISTKAAGEAGKDFREMVSGKGSPSWFSDLVAKVAPPDPGEAPDETHVAKAMAWLQGNIDKGGDWVEKTSGGKFTKEDVSMFANGAMNALGLKGAMKGGAALEQSIREKMATAKPDEPTAYTTPEAATKPASRAKEDIERTTGIKDTATADKMRKARRADARKAFEDDKPYADYLNNWVEEDIRRAQLESTREARLKEAEGVVPRSEPSDPVVLREGAKVDDSVVGQRALDTALAKVAKGKRFNLTTEERVALQANGMKTTQMGGATLDHMKGVAAVTLGLGLGATLDKDNPIEGAILGVLGGAGLSTGAIPKLYSRAKAALKPDTRIRINDLTERQEYQLAAGTRSVWQGTQAFMETVPEKADREAIHRAIDAGKVASLPPKLQKGAKLAQDFYSQMAKVGQEAGVLDEVRTNYTTHLWKNSDAQKLAEIQAKRPGGFATSTRFAKERSHVTLEEGKKAGLIPVTEDLAEVMGIYGNSVVRAAANKNLVNSLREAKTPSGEKLIIPMSKAPQGYVPIQAGVLNGLRVHPDIAPSLKFVMEGQDPGAAVAALTALNTALKRNAVSFSLFHAKALADAMLGAVNNPLTVGKVIAQAAAPRVFGKNRFLEQLRKGGAGDLPDLALKSGLKFSYERGESSVEDVGGGFYKGMQGVQNMLDQAVPGLGKPVAAYARVNHAFDNFMWGRLHSAMKLEVFAAKTEGLMENSAKKGKPLTQEQAGRIAATYTNDIFGGLNWGRIAEGAKTKWGRDVSLAMLSPAGRRGLQLLMFAPDWTLSTARAFTQAFGKGSGMEGLTSATTLADLHRQQLIRSALYYVTIGDAVNYYNTGHHIWDNKDWTRVELGDGRTMQLSKHFAEPFHWMMHPGQQAINKLGTLPKEGIEQAMGVDYLNAKGRMPPMKNRFAHAAKSALPIGVQSGMEQGMGPAISSSLGVPIYGQTDKQKREAAYQARQKRLAEYVKSLEEKK